ncbi:unnamed protein product [Brassica rapa]|uniref:Uncharacterized protein n=1 Tax=Brassica campestris TaxID=3711 RepID=A0A8D9DC71_BRACM|nr:unnamed protein product [Brassica rapa]
MDIHGRPVCADGHTRTSCVCGRTPTDVLCVLNRQPTWAKITRTVHGKGQRAESKDQRADMSTNILCMLADTHIHTRIATDVLCVLTDSHEQPQTSCVCWRTPTDVLCVLNRQPTWAKMTQTVHGKGQRAESKDQRADMCTDGKPRTSSPDVLCVLTDTHGHTRTAPDVMCVLMDTHGRPVCTEQTANDSHRRPVCADGHTQTALDVRCVLTYTHRCLVCADGHPRTSYSPRGPKSPKQSTGRASVLSPRTNVLICVLMDSHRPPVCADGHTRTATDVMCVLTDTHGRPVCAAVHPRIQPTWAKITRTVHGKGQRADMCTDGRPPRTATNVLCVLADTHGRPPTWAKITRTVHGKGQRADIPRKGQRAESKDQRADMCTDGQPHTACMC